MNKRFMGVLGLASVLIWGTFMLAPQSIAQSTPTTTPLGGGGDLIAFTRLIESEKAARGRAIEVFTVNLRNGQETQLTELNTRVFSLAWSPDGKLLAFTASVETTDDTNETMLYIMNDDGSNLRALAQVEEYSNISFSPDSSRLVYSFGKGHDSEIYMLYIEDGTIEQITHNAFGDYEPIWSPDGEKILFSSARDNELYVMALDGSNLQQLTDNELVDIGVSWSPDGQYIVFSSYLADRRIQFVMNSDGSAPRNITEQPYDGILDVVWSPDGQSLGFIIRDGYKQELYLIDVDGSNLRQIAGDLKMASDLAWSPDGRYLIFGVGLPYTQLYISTIDNTDIYSLTRDDKRTIFELSWQPAPR